MSGLKSTGEVIAAELGKNFLLHPLLEGKEDFSGFFYAEVLLKLADNSFDDFYLNNAVALELLALSFRKHFQQEAKPIDIIKGDFYYARALSYTILSGLEGAVKILAGAVVRQTVFAGDELTDEPFISLLEAAVRLDLLKRKEEVFAAGSPEVVENLKKLLVQLREENTIKYNKVLKKLAQITEAEEP